MEALGFSINTLTLFGMVLAIGIVVDDAIVVVENVERHMTQDGLSPKDAAKKAMDEVTGPVIAIVLVLAAVFVPVAFLGGITGELYKQFAITIALSVAISGFVALTLSPALVRAGSQAKPRLPQGILETVQPVFRLGTNALCREPSAVVLKRSVIALAIFGIADFRDPWAVQNHPGQLSSGRRSRLFHYHRPVAGRRLADTDD